MELDKIYTVQLTFHGLVITDEKGQVLNPYRADHLLKMWNSYRQASVYLSYGYSRKVHAWCHKIGFSNDVQRRMQQLRLNLLCSIRGKVSNVMIAERHLQGYFIEKGKWLGGECFDLSDEDVDLIKSLNTTQDIRKLPTQISWDYIAEWNREVVTEFKRDYIKGVTYTEWVERRKSNKVILK